MYIHQTIHHQFAILVQRILTHSQPITDQHLAFLQRSIALCLIFPLMKRHLIYLITRSIYHTLLCTRIQFSLDGSRQLHLLPIFVLQQYLLQHAIVGPAFLHACRVALPQPTHSVRESQCAIFDTMIASIPLVKDLISRKVEGRLHQQVILKPLAKDGVPHVIPTILHVDSQWFGFGLAHDGRILMSATHRHKRTHRGIYTAKQVRTIPCHTKGSYTTATGSRDSTIIGILGESNSLAAVCLHTLDTRQHLCFDKGCERIISRIKLLATIVAHHLTILVVHHTRIDKHAHRDWHLARSNQIIHHRGGIIQNTIHTHQ